MAGPRRGVRSIAHEVAALPLARRQLRAAQAELAKAGVRRVSNTLVFIPAWNEEGNLPGRPRGPAQRDPGADVLVVDDGSTDATVEVARAGGAQVLSLGANRGLRVGVAVGYRYAHEHDYAFCGRVDADGQHPGHELARLLQLVRDDVCDVAVGSRSSRAKATSRTATCQPVAPLRHGRAAARARVRAGTAVRRRDQRALRGQRKGAAAARAGVHDGAPEVEALIRISNAGLRLEEVPVDMAERAGGVSKLRGSKAVKLVLTVAAVLVTAQLARRRLR